MRTDISVIMAAHNSERTIRESVNSVLKYLPQGGELLIFNDGSTDRTGSILDSYTDNRIKVFSSMTRVGRSEARNTLAQEGRHQWLAIVDSDDIALPGRFHLSRSDLEHSVVASTALIKFEGWSNVQIPQLPIALNSPLVLSALTSVNPIVHSSVLMKKESFIRAGGYLNVESEDYNLWLRMANNRESFRRRAIPSVIYRVHQSQVTRSNQYIENRMDALTLDLCRELRFLEGKNRDSWFQRVEEFNQANS
jgi:glycosyltransferase involved in cell wall biosynthesis